jgi:hypothetical protein
MNRYFGAACVGLISGSQKLLAVTAASLLMSVGVASAATITGYYSVSDTMTHGNAPTITNDLGTFTSGHQSISTTLQGLTIGYAQEFRNSSSYGFQLVGVVGFPSGWAIRWVLITIPPFRGQSKT